MESLTLDQIKQLVQSKKGISWSTFITLSSTAKQRIIKTLTTKK